MGDLATILCTKVVETNSALIDLSFIVIWVEKLGPGLKKALHSFWNAIKVGMVIRDYIILA